MGEKFSWRKKESMNHCAIRAFALIKCKLADFETAIQQALRHRELNGQHLMFCKNPDAISEEQLEFLRKKLRGMIKEAERFKKMSHQNWSKPAG